MNIHLPFFTFWKRYHQGGAFNLHHTELNWSVQSQLFEIFYHRRIIHNFHPYFLVFFFNFSTSVEYTIQKCCPSVRQFYSHCWINFTLHRIFFGIVQSEIRQQNIQNPHGGPWGPCLVNIGCFGPYFGFHCGKQLRVIRSILVFLGTLW